MGGFERWNGHLETLVEQEVFGLTLQLAQDPSSLNLGTSVWDASIVLAKFLELNARKGDFSRVKVRGRRALELGAGMGLGGMAFALLGAHVTLTDYGDVMPLLERNVERNLSPAALKLNGHTGEGGWAAEAGRVDVLPLDWTDFQSWQAFSPPYEYILAADCVYSETAVPHLLATVLHFAGPRSTVVICNEFRSHAVHDMFMESFGEHFAIRKVSQAKMDPRFRHPLISIYLLKKKRASAAAAAPAEGTDAGLAEASPAGSPGGLEAHAEASSIDAATEPLQPGEGDGVGGSVAVDGGLGAALEGLHVAPEAAAEAGSFALRRQGAALAQALRGVQVSAGPPLRTPHR